MAYLTRRYREACQLQEVLYQEATNGLEAGLKPKYALAWVTIERLKREMRGIPPLKAISAPWPMKRARARAVNDEPQEIEITTKESLLSQTVATPRDPSTPGAIDSSLVNTPTQSGSGTGEVVRRVFMVATVVAFQLG